MSQGVGPQDPSGEPADGVSGERLDATWWDVDDIDDVDDDGDSAGAPAAAIAFPGDGGSDAGPVEAAGASDGTAFDADADADAETAADGDLDADLDADEPDAPWRDESDVGADGASDRITFGTDATEPVRAATPTAADGGTAASVTRASATTGGSPASANAAGEGRVGSARSGGGASGGRGAVAAARRRRWPLVAGIAVLGAVAIGLISQSGGSKNDKSAPITAVKPLPTSVASSPSATVARTTAAPATVAPPTVSVTTAAPATAARSTVAPATIVSTAAPRSATTAPVPTTNATATTAPAATVAPARASANSPANPAAVDILKPVRWALVSKGKVYLRGRVPSQAVAEEIRAKVALAADDENVFVEYTIDPSAPLPPNAPIFVTDTVLFDTDSSVIRPEFQAVLELGRYTMERNPKVTVTVIGRADARGDPDHNLQLSRDRAQAAVDFMARNGLDRSRFTVIAKGAEQPIADQSTSAGMQANRAVEFIAYGFLET